METPRCPKIPNPSADWKLNPNVECRIILNKLKIKTPEYETIEFCRMLTNRSAPKEPTSSHTKDLHFKSEFVLDILLNEILGKCEEKCKVCEEYVQQLRHHIIQAHSGHPNPSPHPQTVTVFKCDICSSIYSSPSMLIRHRNTHLGNSDTLKTTCTNEPQPVRFDSNNISSFNISSVTRTNENSVSAVQCEDHPHQPVPVSPMNLEWNSLKQESSSSQSELEISNPNSPGILQHMNHFSTIVNNLKQECNVLECEGDIHDPLLFQYLQVPSFVKSECTEISTESEQQTVLMTHEKSYNDTPTSRDRFSVPTELITITGQKPNECDICRKCFDNLHNLTRHKLIHTGERPYKCDVCGKCFGQNSDLIRHKVTHTGEKSFRCDVCSMCFSRRFVLTRHKLTHTGEKSLLCDVCGKGFLLQDRLTKHKLTHTGEKPHKCDVCAHGFNRRSYLTQHKLRHTGERPHVCEVCGKCFFTHNILTKHKLTHTGESERPHKCDVCEKSFKGRFELAQHKLKHTGEKPYTCDSCGQSFYQRSNLNRHKLVHTGEKPHECNVCGKCFALQFSLTKHKLTHTGVRPHKCDVCGKSFKQSAHLTRHKLTHTGEKSFRCDVCGQNFYGQHELTKHKLKHVWKSTTTTLVNHLNEDRETEEERCQEDPLLNLEVSS